MTMTSSRGTEDVANRKNLSKNVLQMKFMQKGVVVKVDEKEEMEKRIKRSKEHWVLGCTTGTGPEQLPYHFDTTAVVCEDLLPVGRMAFKNFNPEVERTHKQVLKLAKKKCTTTDREDEAEEISDDEMAERFESLVHTIDSKFRGKRKQPDDEDDGNRRSDSDDDDDEETRELKKRARRGFLKPSY